MKSFAVVLVCYNRIAGLKRLLDSLNRVDFNGRNDITLIFSIDNCGRDTVECFAKNYKWKYGKKIIRTFSERQGLKKHILQCGDYTEQYDIVAVLEDDIVVSDSMYAYAYAASEFYWNDDRIAGISLYNFQKNWLKWAFRFEPMKTDYDTYFIKLAQSWGQIWIRHKWIAFKNWYESNSVFKKSLDIPQYLNDWPESSWLKFHDRYCIEEDKYFVYPYYALSSNSSDVGEHSNLQSNDYQVEMQFGKQQYNFQTFNDKAVVYDEYFNREGLAEYLNVPSKDLCLDMYGTRKIKENSKYVLTAVKYPGIRPVKSFRLSTRPIETAIIYAVEGEGIYLYRTSEIINYKGHKDDFDLCIYEIRTHDWKMMLRTSIKLGYMTICAKIKRLAEG